MIGYRRINFYVLIKKYKKKALGLDRRRAFIRSVKDTRIVVLVTDKSGSVPLMIRDIMNS